MKAAGDRLSAAECVLAGLGGIGAAVVYIVFATGILAIFWN